MTSVRPRVQAPAIVRRDEVFEVRTIVTHPMETGLRVDEAGHLIPRDLIHSFTCRYNDDVVFSADLRESVAANPFLSFHVRANESGRLTFTWQGDDGAVSTVETSLTVTS